MPEIPYVYRWICLITLMGTIAGIDWWWNRSASTRWREYGFLLVCGMIGSVLVIGIDHLTATISPEYFVIGKELPSGDRFRIALTGFGFRVGFLPGIVVGGTYLLANNPSPTRRSLSFFELLRFGCFPVLGALLLAPIICLLAIRMDPMGIGEWSQGVELPANRIPSLLAVWGLHAGAYLGGALGIVWGVLGIRKRRA